MSYAEKETTSENGSKQGETHLMVLCKQTLDRLTIIRIQLHSPIMLCLYVHIWKHGHGCCFSYILLCKTDTDGKENSANAQFTVMYLFIINILPVDAREETVSHYFFSIIRPSPKSGSKKKGKTISYVFHCYCNQE